MGGGLLQLVATGIQDKYLVGNPQISYFKVVYKRHTNFSIESILNTFTGNIDFGNKLKTVISRKGDLIHKMVIEIDLPAITSTGSNTISYVNSLGHALINYVQIRIGGNVIDKHYGEWMEIWSQLTRPESKKYAYQEMLSRYDTFTTVNSALTVYIPLDFWFCRNIGLALPLISLQYHDVELEVDLQPLSKIYTFGPFNYYTGSQSGTTITITSSNPEFTESDVGKKVIWNDGSEYTISSKTSSTVIEVGTSATKSSQEFYIKPTDTISGTPSIVDARLYVDYIFLDTFERKQFANMKHRYLIEQVQFNEADSYNANETSKKFGLAFNLPVKSLYWISQIDRYSRDNDIFNFSDTVNPNVIKTDPVSKAILLLNGEERFEERNGKYFRVIEPFNKHTNVPNDFIYMYSFSLQPERHQPSGTCNFSKIDNSDIKITFKTGINAGKFRCYAVNYNVLRIESGMAGVAFSS